MILIDAKGHMVSTTSEHELHLFARQIGLKREWYQGGKHPHYDLTTAQKRRQAIGNGARKVSSRELIRKAWWQADDFLERVKE